jgi:chromosome partitioning protein
MKTIAIANQKGGVGKTTTAVNLSACLARLGQRVLLVDLDQQVNATQHLGAEIPSSEEQSSFALLVASSPHVKDLVRGVGPNLALIPAHIALAEVDLRLASAVNPDGRLVRALAQVKDDYDYAILDCPPSLGRATINAFCAATHLIVAVETAWFSYEAVTRLMTIANDVIEQFNPDLKVYALATLHRAQVNVHRDVLQRVQEVFQAWAFETVIRHTAAFVEAAAAHQSIAEYAHGSRGHQDYAALADELLRKTGVVRKPRLERVVNG